MQTTLYRLLPRPLRAYVTPAHCVIAIQFFRFGAVGGVGLIVDTAMVYAFRHSLGPVSFVAQLASARP